MEREIALQLYMKKALSLPNASDYQLWLIWENCLEVAQIPFGEAVRDPDLPDLPRVTAAELGIGRRFEPREPREDDG